MGSCVKDKPRNYFLDGFRTRLETRFVELRLSTDCCSARRFDRYRRARARICVYSRTGEAVYFNIKREAFERPAGERAKTVVVVDSEPESRGIFSVWTTEVFEGEARRGAAPEDRYSGKYNCVLARDN